MAKTRLIQISFILSLIMFSVLHARRSVVKSPSARKQFVRRQSAGSSASRGTVSSSSFSKRSSRKSRPVSSRSLSPSSRSIGASSLSKSVSVVRVSRAQMRSTGTIRTTSLKKSRISRGSTLIKSSTKSKKTTKKPITKTKATTTSTSGKIKKKATAKTTTSTSGKIKKSATSKTTTSGKITTAQMATKKIVLITSSSGGATTVVGQFQSLNSFANMGTASVVGVTTSPGGRITGMTFVLPSAPGVTYTAYFLRPSHHRRFWGPRYPYYWGGYWGPCFYYPYWGFWYTPYWQCWYYPWFDCWYFPYHSCWYYPRWRYRVFFYAVTSPCPYIVVDNSPATDDVFFAVYEKKIDEDGNVTYTQTEAPRRIKRRKNLKIYLEGRTADEVIILSKTKSALPVDLSEHDARKYSTIELGNVDSVKQNKSRGELQTAKASRADRAKMKKFQKKLGSKGLKKLEEISSKIESEYAASTSTSD